MAKIIENERRIIRLSVDDILNIVREYQQLTLLRTHEGNLEKERPIPARRSLKFRFVIMHNQIFPKYYIHSIIR